MTGNLNDALFRSAGGQCHGSGISKVQTGFGSLVLKLNHRRGQALLQGMPVPL